MAIEVNLTPGQIVVCADNLNASGEFERIQRSLHPIKLHPIEIDPEQQAWW